MIWIALDASFFSGFPRLQHFGSKSWRAESNSEKPQARLYMLFAQETLPEMILGVGSVTDAAAASDYMKIGANFVVSPVFREDIAIICNRRKVLWSPGCGTLTEIAMAEERGAEIVKLFPGSVYGPEFVKAIKGPQPWTSIMPTGGVNTSKENLKSWFDAGVTCVGMGSQLISKTVIEQKDFKGLKATVSEVINTIQALK